MKRHATLEEFLSKEEAGTAPISVPPPLPGGSAVDPTLKAILDGVNEIRATAVTREALRSFADLQSAEFRTFVKAENAPIHSAISRLAADVSHLAKDSAEQFDRIQRLERHIDDASVSGSSASKRGPDPNDIALQQVAFVGFPQASSVKQRLDAMNKFMKDNFPEISVRHTDLDMDKNGKQTVHGFVELASKKHARCVTDAVKSRGLKVQGYNDVVVKPGLTKIDKARNWALREAERLIRADPKFNGQSIKANKRDNRGVYVNDKPAFVQRERYAKGGEFIGEFSHLRLR